MSGQLKGVQQSCQLLGLCAFRMMLQVPIVSRGDHKKHLSRRIIHPS